MNLLCALFGHRWSVPSPPPETVEMWVKGTPPPTDLLWRDCARCGRGERMSWAGYWSPR